MADGPSLRSRARRRRVRSLPTDANFPTTWLVGRVDFGSCKAVIRLLIDCVPFKSSSNPLRVVVRSNRAETQAPNLARVLSDRIERNVFLLQRTKSVAELNSKICVGSSRAGRLPDVSGLLARTCVVFRRAADRVPYPRLLPAPAFVDPLSARHGGSARNSTGVRASAGIGTPVPWGPSAWLVRETPWAISPPGDAPIATPGVAS